MTSYVLGVRRCEKCMLSFADKTFVCPLCGDVMQTVAGEVAGKSPSFTRDNEFGWVYFIQPTYDEPKNIKIGKSRNVSHRLNDLQNQCPVRLQLLAMEPGYTVREQELHRQFATLRRHGEWFSPGAALVDYVAALPRVSGMDRVYWTWGQRDE